MEAELNLVNKVELRIALADTDSKFEASLNTFLAPLLLKLASPHAEVRQAVLKAVQHLIGRLNTAVDVKLPVLKLLEQVHKPNCSGDSTAVRLYTMLFLSKGVDRLAAQEKQEIVPLFINSISQLPLGIASRMFHVTCKLLLSWQPPLKGTIQEDQMREKLCIDAADESFLIDRFTDLFLLVPTRTSGSIPRGYSCPGLSSARVSFLTYDAGVSFDPETLAKFKLAVARFFSCGFDDNKLVRFLIVASVDSSSLAESCATALKRISVDYENAELVDSLISLFVGGNGTPPCGHYLQEKILSLLGNSLAATQHPKVSLVSSIGLNSSHYKLRSLALKFVQRVAKANGNVSTSGDYSTSIASLIRNNLHAEGWPRMQLNSSVPNFNQGILQRRTQYETLGEILKRDFELVKDFSYIEFLFDSLRGDLVDLRSTIQECLTMLCVHLPRLPQQSKDKLKKMANSVLVNDQFSRGEDNDTIASLRYIAIKYINVAFPFDDAEARMLNVLGSMKLNRYDVVEEAKKGLHPYWFNVLQSSNTLEFKSTPDLLGVNKLVTFPSFDSFVKQLESAMSYARDISAATLSHCLSTACKFALHCLVSEAILGKSTVIVQDQDWHIRIDKALQYDEKVGALFAERVGTMSKDSFLTFVSILLNEFTTNDADGDFTAVSESRESTFGEICLELVQCALSEFILELVPSLGRIANLLNDSRALDYTSIEVLSKLIGIIGSFGDYNSVLQNTILPGIETDSAKILTSGYLLSRCHYRRQPISSETQSVIGNAIELSLEKAETRMLSCGLTAVGEMAKFGLSLSSDKVQPKVKSNESAVLAWAMLSLADTFENPEFSPFEQVLYDTHTCKQVEFLFTTGEAFSVIASGWDSKFLCKQLDIQDPSLLGNLPTSRDRLEFLLGKVLEACSSTKPSLRKAGCIWLLSLVQYNGHLEAIMNKSAEIHLAFMKFLADRDELVQESASRGLSIIYELGNPDLKETLVKSLLKSFTDSTVTLSSGTVSADTQLFQPGVLNTGDGSVSTYKDILNLASEVGDPGLVYKFMSLSRSSTLWSSRKGIAFSLGAIMSKSSLESLLFENESLATRLIPKLYRYKFDPFESVARSMNDIWSALVPNPSATIQRYYETILQELLNGMGNKEWRTREASTLALCDLLQLLTLEKYEDKLEDIWTMAFRSMDDIKDSVREAGNKLTRGLSTTLVRSIDIDGGASPARSKATLDTLLPFLLGNKGLLSDAEEIRDFSLRTILDLIKKTGSAIRPFVPQLLNEFILMLSTLEPQVINYLALNADKYNLTANDIDSKRLQGITGSPIMASIEKLIELVDLETLEPVITKVVAAVKKSVGLPSKVGASKVVILLTQRHPSMSNPGRLLTVCTSQLKDRNEVVASSFAITLGHVIKICNLEELVAYANQLTLMYFESGDEKLQRVAAVASESVAKYAHAQYESVASIFLPVAFIAKNDQTEAVAETYSREWTENTSSASSTVKLYIEEISSLVTKYLSSPTFSIRQTCAKSIAKACYLIDSSIGEKQVQILFETLVESCKGKSWDGKQFVVEALVELSSKFKSFLESSDLMTTVTKTLITEIKRRNKEYQRAVIPSYCDFSGDFPSDQVYQELTIVLESIINDEYYEDEEIKMDSDINKKSSKANIEREEFRIALLKRVVKAFKVYDNRYNTELLDFIGRCLSLLFNSSVVLYTWRSQLASAELVSVLAQELKDYQVPLFAELWKLIFTHTVDESIENVRVKVIRLGGELNDWFGVDTLPDLRVIAQQQNSSVVEMELNKVL